MSDSVKFWIQTLIVPVVLAGVGYYINNTLQQQQRAFDKIKFTE
jgi:Ni,Fe-hydrogenase I cytochrome b subunit